MRIWSAGCSGGQEIYSLAIFLNELLPDISHWKLYLLATDINTVALTEARRACYTNWSFRETSPYFLKKYFIESNNKYIVNESIQRLVTFSYLNLANDIFPSLLTNTNAMDLILCRNVLIYIEPTMARQIMNRFIACLMPQGILLTGPSDHVEVPTDLLERVQLADASYYRKRLPVSFDTDALNPSIVKKTPTATEDISQQQSRVIPLHEPFPDVLPVFNKQLLLLNQTGCWHDILIACDQGIRKFGATAHFLQLKANALANIGHMDEALQTCKMSLEKDPLEKHTYLIQGLILVEQGALVEAESVFHKALYLDHQFLLAHYQLALLLLKIGKHSLAIKSFNNALVLAEQGDPRKEIEGAPGVTFEHFTDILRKEILIYLEAKS